MRKSLMRAKEPLIILAATGLWLPGIQGSYFLSDDFVQVETWGLSPVWPWFGAEFVGYYRPLTALLFRLDYLCQGQCAHRGQRSRPAGRAQSPGDRHGRSGKAEAGGGLGRQPAGAAGRMNRARSLSLVRQNPFKAGAALVVLCLLFAYLPALLAFFVKDDLALITSAGTDFPSLFTHSWPGGFFRPGAEFLSGVQYRLFGLHPGPYHLVSLAAHGIAAFLVYRISGFLLGDSARGLVAAAVFALHPLHTESVSWISGQMSLFSGLCCFLAVYLVILQPPRHYTLWFLALLVTFASGVGFYENFAVVPLLWVVLYSSVKKLRLQNLLPSLLGWLLSAGILGAYAYWRLAVLGLRGGYYGLNFSMESGLTNLVYYLYLLNGGSAIGGRIIRYRPEEILSSSFLEVFPPLFIAHTLLIGGAGGVFVFNRIRKSRSTLSGNTLQKILLPGAWILISLLPALLLEERPRRIAYMAVAGYALALCQAFFYLQQKTRLGTHLARAGLIGYTVLLAATLHRRNHDWRAAGELEKNLPQLVSSTECAHLAFDVPDLFGDALFFNSFSVAYWLERQTGKKGLAIYAPHEILSADPLPKPSCYFRLEDGQIEQVAPAELGGFPSFVRGRNWVTADR